MSSTVEITPTEALFYAQEYESWLFKQAAAARFPDLLRAPLLGNALPVYMRTSSASGLIARVMRHDTLPPNLQRQLAEFRFQQCVLWHWYDTGAIISHHIHTDPAFASLPPSTLHGCIGSDDGQILAYFDVQPAVERTGQGVLCQILSVFSHSHRLGQLNRPFFPAEWEFFGPDVFASLPALASVPIDHIGELECLQRNYAVPLILTTPAIIEAAYTICQVLLLPTLALRALVGCGNKQVRGVLSKLGMPMLYAQEAPVVNRNLPYYWSADMYESGKFWPFVVSADDFLANPEFLPQLDRVLHNGLQDIPRALVRFRRSVDRIAPTAVRPVSCVSAYCWSDEAALRSSVVSTRGKSEPAALAHAVVDTTNLSKSWSMPLEMSGVIHTT